MFSFLGSHRKRRNWFGIFMNKSSQPLLEQSVPLIFVVLWSTGYIGAKLGLPYAEPFTFLAMRMAITFCVLAPIVLIFVKKWPSKLVLGHSVVTGAMIHAGYLGPIFFAIGNGMSAGVSAMIVALQPLTTAFVARVMIGERVTTRQTISLFAALFGVLLIISPRFTESGSGEGITLLNVSCVCFAVLAISIGSVYQKKYVTKTDLRLGAAAQYLGALVPLGIMSFFFETREVVWSGEFIFALFWLVFVLSIGAVTLLMILIQRGSAAQTASLFFLVPVSTAIIAFFMFDERLTILQLMGMVIVVVAVAKATKKTKK